MDLLYLISYAGGAGTEKYVENLMRLYTSRGHICHLAYREDGALSRRAAEAGWPTLQLDLSPRRALPAARRLAEYCRENHIDVIHAQYPRENVIAVLSTIFRPSTRVVFTSHLTIRQGTVWNYVNRIITPRDAAVIAVCTQGAEILRRNGVCPDRIRVIFNGVEPRPLPPRRNVIRDEYGLGEDCFVFVALARYAPEKGLGYLVDSLSLLRRRTDRPFVCLIAGEGEGYDEIGERIRALNLERNVIQAGFRTDTEALLCSADAYVSSALCNEAMSFAILEAMSCGLPLAVTDVGAGRDLAQDCGYVCRPGDTDAMAKNLERLLSDQEGSRALGQASYRRAVSEFDLFRQADELMSLYVRAAAGEKAKK